MGNKKVVHLQPAGKPAKKEVWVDAVGAGNWLAGVERIQEDEKRGAYLFTVGRMEPGRPKTLSTEFRAEDVLDLPKLTQVLAATMIDDGWLEPALKDDLSCLADNLDWFLGLRKPGMGWEWIAVRRKALQVVLDYVWKSEYERFCSLSMKERKQHVFRAMVELQESLTGSVRSGMEDLTGPESSAGMYE